MSETSDALRRSARDLHSVSKHFRLVTRHLEALAEQSQETGGYSQDDTDRYEAEQDADLLERFPNDPKFRAMVAAVRNYTLQHEPGR